LLKVNKKGYKGLGMNGGIARWYAKLVEKDYTQYRELAERIKKMLPGKKTILEVAPGPGFLSVELAKESSYQVTGMDISETFVQIAGEKAKEAKAPVKFLVGNVAKMPLAENQFDLVVCRAAFKNFAQPDRAVDEMFRVLKPGGKAFIVDLRKDVSNQEIDSYVSHLDVGAWDRWMTKWSFKLMLRKRAYSLDQIKGLSANSKFRTYRIDIAPMGFEWWLEK
jgi:ubiquinone/menaquinone biosynthesis C-methylase UbiE